MRRKFGYGLNLVGARRVAILIICTVASLTFAQRLAHQRAIEALTLPPTLPATVVLYEQYNDVGNSSTTSATFTDFPTTNSDLADDFVVPGGQTWQVQSIDAAGVTLMALDLPPIGMSSFTRTVPAFLAPRFTVRCTNQLR